MPSDKKKLTPTDLYCEIRKELAEKTKSFDRDDRLSVFEKMADALKSADSRSRSPTKALVMEKIPNLLIGVAELAKLQGVSFPDRKKVESDADGELSTWFEAVGWRQSPLEVLKEGILPDNVSKLKHIMLAAMCVYAEGRRRKPNIEQEMFEAAMDYWAERLAKNVLSNETVRGLEAERTRANPDRITPDKSGYWKTSTIYAEIEDNGHDPDNPKLNLLWKGLEFKATTLQCDSIGKGVKTVSIPQSQPCHKTSEPAEAVTREDLRKNLSKFFLAVSNNGFNDLHLSPTQQGAMWVLHRYFAEEDPRETYGEISKAFRRTYLDTLPPDMVRGANRDAYNDLRPKLTEWLENPDNHIRISDAMADALQKALAAPCWADHEAGVTISGPIEGNCTVLTTTDPEVAKRFGLVAD